MSAVSITCRRCGETFVADACESINVASCPEMKARVLDGSAFVHECPHCGTANLIPCRTLYHDPSEKAMVWVTGGDEDLERQARSASAKLEGLDGYVLRLVDTSGDLVEKVKILHAGLDDVVMELVKHVTRSELAQKDASRREGLLGAKMRFVSLDGADNAITLAYPQGGQMQMVEVGFNVYEDCRGIVKRNPEFTASGFTKVDAAWIGRNFG